MMTSQIAVFNLHVGDAGKKANKDTIARYGQRAFMAEFPRLFRQGIMSIFAEPPTKMRQYWVGRVTYYVNMTFRSMLGAATSQPPVSKRKKKVGGGVSKWIQ